MHGCVHLISNMSAKRARDASNSHAYYKRNRTAILAKKAIQYRQNKEDGKKQEREKKMMPKQELYELADIDYRNIKHIRYLIHKTTVNNILDINVHLRNNPEVRTRKKRKRDNPELNTFDLIEHIKKQDDLKKQREKYREKVGPPKDNLLLTCGQKTQLLDELLSFRCMEYSGDSEMLICQPCTPSSPDPGHANFNCFTTHYFNMVKQMWKTGDFNHSKILSLTSFRAIDGWERGFQMR